MLNYGIRGNGTKKISLGGGRSHEYTTLNSCKIEAKCGRWDKGYDLGLTMGLGFIKTLVKMGLGLFCLKVLVEIKMGDWLSLK